MLSMVLTAIPFSTSLASQTVNIINDKRIHNEKSCFSSIFETYSSWRGFIEKKNQKKLDKKQGAEQSSKHDTEQALAKTMTKFDDLFGEEKFNYYKNSLACSVFKYEVDGNKVNGYVIKPKSITTKATKTKTLPVLIYNRGGNGNFGGVIFASMMRNLFPIADQGFVIIGSQYRGTFIKNPSALDEFGGNDVDDVLALLDYIPKIEGADAQRIGMYGASRGGMQTHLAVKKAKNIKAIATIAGATDLIKELAFRPAMENVYKKRIPNYNKNKVAELEKRSVINWVDELSPNIPILLLHGESDVRVSVNNSIEFADALTKHNIKHKLVVYPNDDHGLKNNRAAATKELVNWFNQYL